MNWARVLYRLTWTRIEEVLPFMIVGAMHLNQGGSHTVYNILGQYRWRGRSESEVIAITQPKALRTHSGKIILHGSRTL